MGKKKESKAERILRQVCMSALANLHCHAWPPVLQRRVTPTTRLVEEGSAARPPIQAPNRAYGLKRTACTCETIEPANVRFRLILQLALAKIFHAALSVRHGKASELQETAQQMKRMEAQKTG